MEAGHAASRSYPLGMLSDEARLVVERRNGLQATEATLTQAAISAVLSKEGGKHFKTILKSLTEG